MPTQNKALKRIRAEGNFKVLKNGEGTNFTTATLNIGCTPPFGCGQSASFKAPEEARITHNISISVPYGTTEGTFKVLPGDYSVPGANYATRRAAANGWFLSVYHAHEGEIVIENADITKGTMKGSFHFDVEVGGVTTRYEGTFDLTGAEQLPLDIPPYFNGTGAALLATDLLK